MGIADRGEFVGSGEVRDWYRRVDGAATQRAAPRRNRRCSTATQRGTKERGTPWWLAWPTRPRRRQVSRTRRLVCSQLRNCWRRSVGGAGRTQAWADAWRRLASGWRSLFALTGWLQMAARSRCAVTAQEAWTGLVASVGGSEPGSGCAWNEAASFPPHATGGSNGAALNGVHPARGAVGRARRGGGWGREPFRPPQGARCARERELKSGRCQQT